MDGRAFRLDHFVGKRGRHRPCVKFRRSTNRFQHRLPQAFEPMQGLAMEDAEAAPSVWRILSESAGGTDLV